MFNMGKGRVTAIWPEGARLWALGGWGREIRVGDVITEEDEECRLVPFRWRSRSPLNESPHSLATANSEPDAQGMGEFDGALE